MNRRFRQLLYFFLIVLLISISGCSTIDKILGKKTEAPPAPPSDGPPPEPSPPPPPPSTPPQPKDKGTKPSTKPPEPTKPMPKQEPPEETRFYTHTVIYEGETMSIIAGWYLGDIMKYPLLSDANPDIADSNRIRRGDKIRIPENVMKRQDSMTKEYVDSFYKKTTQPPKPPPPPKRDEKKEDAEKPYGPR